MQDPIVKKIVPPFLTIAIPVLNGERFLGEAVASVISQTVDDWEVCVSDNHSQDRTAEVIGGIQHGRRLIYVKSDAQVSMPINWNRAVRMGCGRWVTVLAHDDLLFPNAVERLREFEKAYPMCSCIFSKTQFIDESGNNIEKNLALFSDVGGAKVLSPSHFAAEFAKGMVVPPTGVFFKRDLFERCGGFCEELTGCMDWEFVLRAATLTNVLLVNESLAAYRLHGSQAVKNFVRAQHYDPEIMQGKILSYEHFTDYSRRVAFESMKAFVYRGLIETMIAKDISLRSAFMVREQVLARLKSWHREPEVKRLLPDLQPESWKLRVLLKITQTYFGYITARFLLRHFFKRRD